MPEVGRADDEDVKVAAVVYEPVVSVVIGLSFRTTGLLDDFSCVICLSGNRLC